MSNIFITRHKGAQEWLKLQNIDAELIEHFTTATLLTIKAGDKVMGILPVDIIAQICNQGAQFHHLQMEMPPELRGQEISCSKMIELGAKLVQFHVTHIK